MRGIFCLLFFAGFCLSLHSVLSDDALNSDFELENGVIVLTDDNFESVVKEKSPILVEFYAPWCGHCKRLDPLYIRAAEILENRKSRASLGKLDATNHTKSTKRFQVQGYPTLKLFLNGVDGTVMDFDGARDEEGIVQWLEEKTDPDYKPPPSAVLTLTGQNFSKLTNEAEIMLVEFFAPWCGHCKKLAPEFEKAAQKLSKLPIKLATVDGTIERDLAKQFSVTGYPTLKIFKRGKSFDYDGPREAEGIIEYMISRSKPACSEISSIDQIDKSISKDDVTIVAFIDQEKHEKFFDAYTEACEANREEFKHMYYTHSEKVAKRFKVQSMGRIVIFYPEKYWSKFEPKFATFDQIDAGKDEISKFFLTKSTPLVGQRTQSNQMKRYESRPLIVAYFTIDFGHAGKDETQFWRQKVLNVAQKYPSLRFAMSDEEEYSQELKDAGLGESGLEVNVVAYGINKRRHPMSPEKYDEFDEEAFKEFLDEFSEGKVKPFIKSQPIPKKDETSVKVLVGLNVEEICNDESKDVLIEFYAPWCGHCKSLAPIYEELAKKLKPDRNLIIAKFDATANDVPDQFEVQGFPTIYFSVSGKKDQPILYKGDRTGKDLEDFLQKNAVASFKSEEKTEL